MTNENWVKDSVENAPLDVRAAQLAAGQITLGEYIGFGKQELYVIAQQAYQLLNSGRVEEARDIYQGLVAADPYDSVFHCHLGSAQLRLGNTDEAFREFESSLQYNIANIDAFVGRGEIHLMRGEIKEAIDDLSKAIELDPQASRKSTVRARAALLAVRDALEKQTTETMSQSA